MCWGTPNFWENALIAEKKLFIYIVRHFREPDIVVHLVSRKIGRRIKNFAERSAASNLSNDPQSAKRCAFDSPPGGVYVPPHISLL